MTTEEQLAKADVLVLQGKLNTLKSKGANLERIFSILQDFDSVFNNMDNAGKKSIIGAIFAWAYAKCLGRWKPKYLDEYEFNVPFSALFQREEVIPLSIGLRHSAVR